MKSVTEETKAKALGVAKVVINTMYYTEIEGVNCSLFEIAACGAFQITDAKPCLDDLFQPGLEVETFRSRGELKEKVDYYLAHPEERAIIAENGRRRALTDHTYQKRLTTIFSTLGLIPQPLTAAAEVNKSERNFSHYQ